MNEIFPQANTRSDTHNLRSNSYIIKTHSARPNYIYKIYKDSSPKYL